MISEVEGYVSELEVEGAGCGDEVVFSGFFFSDAERTRRAKHIPRVRQLCPGNKFDTTTIRRITGELKVSEKDVVQERVDSYSRFVDLPKNVKIKFEGVFVFVFMFVL